MEYKAEKIAIFMERKKGSLDHKKVQGAVTLPLAFSLNYSIEPRPQSLF